ncbi:MAG: helicase-related protein, partial [Planctomycetota bacterium]|nr:helicase-related protein [Planctomycetota bacterium]
KQARQVRALREGVDILVATPGRLLDLVQQKHIRLDQVEVFVLDEADRMLDMGFIEDIRKVVDLVPAGRQTLFFSATVSREIRRLADSLLRDPVRIETAPESTTVDRIQQRLCLVDQPEKPGMLKSILDQDSVDRALVFTRTKHGADRLVRFLRKSGIQAEAIHSDRTQHQRTRAMQAFREGRCMVLIATDIASRGIDVDDITHVVNFDLPLDPESYVHRIGRTARAGSGGIAISLCDQKERRLLKTIERRCRIRIDVLQTAEALCEPGTDAAPRPAAPEVEPPRPERKGRHERARHGGTEDRPRRGTRRSKHHADRPSRTGRRTDSSRTDRTTTHKDSRKTTGKHTRKNDRTVARQEDRKVIRKADRKGSRKGDRTTTRKPARTGTPRVEGRNTDRTPRFERRVEHPTGGAGTRRPSKGGPAKPKRYQSRGWGGSNAGEAESARGSGRTDRRTEARRTDRSKTGRTSRASKTSTWTNRADRAESSRRSERTDRSDRSDRSERRERTERSGKSTWSNAPKRTGRTGKGKAAHPPKDRNAGKPGTRSKRTDRSPRRPEAGGGWSGRPSGSGRPGGSTTSRKARRGRSGKGIEGAGRHAGTSTRGQRRGKGAGQRVKGGYSARPGSSSHRRRNAGR